MPTPIFELLAEDIRALNVDMAFGLMSDDTATLINALAAQGVRFVASRHENSAVAMAEGYAAATGRLGVAVIGRGPAAANCVNAAGHAARTGSRVLIVYGDGPRTVVANAPGPDLKAFDAATVIAGAGLDVFRVANSGSLRPMLAAAAEAAHSGRAAALFVPKDLLEELVERPAEPLDFRPRPKIYLPTRRGQPGLPLAADVIARSRRPLIVAGWGAVQADAREAIERLGEKIGAGYVTTLQAAGFFTGNVWNLGIIGSFSHSAARRYIDEADCVIVFGASLNIFTTSAGEALPPGVPVIHVDKDRSMIGRNWYADIALVGDAAQVAGELATLAPDAAGQSAFRTAEMRDLLTGFDIANDFTPAHTQRTIDPRSAAVALGRMLPATRNVLLDVGNLFQVTPFLGTTDPRRLKYTSEFGSIGLAFGTALGYCAAEPDVPTMLVTGDGSLLMTLGELSTCVQEDLPLIIVVMNDACLSAERHYLDLREMPVDKTMLPMIDFADVAACFGFETRTVTSMAELEACAALLQGNASPVLIDIKINPAVPAGFLAEFVTKR